MTQDNSKIKYILYTRKSTDSEDRQMLSLDDQSRELEEMAHRENLSIVENYGGSKRGESHTAHKKGRPIFTRIMQRIEAGHANGLIVYNPNRVARNAFDGGWVITMMDEGKLIEVKTPTRTYKNNPDDKFWLQFEFGMAKKSSDDNSVVVKRGLKTKIQMGWFPSYSPEGYLNTKNFELKGQNTIFTDSERFDFVRRMWNLMLTGNYTPPQILEIATRDWHYKSKRNKPLSRSTIYRIFTNPFYYGWFEYKGELHKGSHEPMVTEEEFDLVQKLLGRDGRPRPKTHRFAFTGLMKCPCGAMITAEEKIKRQKNGNTHHYVYYHCTKQKDKNCIQKGVELKDLNTQIDTLLKNLTISDKFKGWAIKYLHEIRQNEAKSNENILENKQKSLLQITKRLDSLLLKYTSPENDGEKLISHEEYQNLKTNLLKEKGVLESELKAQGGAIEQWIELSEKTFNFAQYARLWFSKGDLETRRAIFASLSSHLVLKEQNINVELHPYFKVIFENLPQVEKELMQIRTSEKLYKSGQVVSLLTKCPTLRRR